MDISTIATTTVTALVPYLVKGGEKIAEKIAEEGWEARRNVWDSIQRRFRGDDLILLNLFRDEPEDVRLQGKVELRLEDYIRDNPDFGKQLESLLSTLNQPHSEQTINISGDRNNTFQDISNSRITIK